MGTVAAGAALGLGGSPWDAACGAAAGAALAHAIRTLAGDSPAALAGAGLASLLAIAMIVERGGGLALSWLAIAAAAWTFAELARPTKSPLVALVPATLAAILEPGCAALIAIAGTRLVTAPWQRPRWAIAVPIGGGLIVVLAIIAGATDGSLAALWYRAPRHSAPGSALSLLGDALGPLVGVAALAGLALVARVRLANLAIGACVVGALLVDLRAGAPGPTTLGLAALCAGLAVGRLAGMIRIGSAQAIVGVTCGALLLLPPVWTAIERGQRVSIASASR
jgi:hypothetical protein